MTITATQTAGIERIQSANGAHLDDAASPAVASIDLGFRPRRVEIVNLTDRISFEWVEGMTSAHALKTVAAGTRTAETSGGVTILATGKGFSFVVLQNKQYYWNAQS